MIATPPLSPADQLRGARNVLRQLGRELVALSRAQDLPGVADLGLDVGMLASRAEHLGRVLDGELEALPDDHCRGSCPFGRCTCAEDLVRREGEL
jgi:hypothetical protein